MSLHPELEMEPITKATSLQYTNPLVKELNKKEVGFLATQVGTYLECLNKVDTNLLLFHFRRGRIYISLLECLL